MAGIGVYNSKIPETTSGTLQAPDLSQLLAGLNTPVPGLTEGQKGVMKSRLANQGKTNLRSVLEGLGSALGQGSTAFALNAARMKQGVGSDVAAKMADVDIAEADKNRTAEFQRRSQALQGAGLQGQLYGIEKGAETSRYGIDQNVQNNRLQQLMTLISKMPQSSFPAVMPGVVGETGSYRNPEYAKWASLAKMLGGGGLLDL